MLETYPDAPRIEYGTAEESPAGDKQSASSRGPGRTDLASGARVTGSRASPLRNWQNAFKRAEDVILSSVLLIVATPVMLFVAALIACNGRGPVMIRQNRFGYGNVPFQIYKFRTMYFDPADLSGIRPTVPGDKRVTRVGRVLRATSVDELPQLMNVLRGEMSLVGPRPHPVDMQVEGRFYQDVVPNYFTRHLMKPGITGLAQINGCRGLVDTREKAEKRLEYDLRYIENWSPWLDLDILMRTLVKGFTSSGAF